MTRVLSMVPAWAITAGYLAVSWLGVVVVGPPSDSIQGFWTTIAALALFILIVGLRRRQIGLIVGTVIGMTGALIFVIDLADVGQPWAPALALLIPFAVYVNCDSNGPPDGKSE